MEVKKTEKTAAEFKILYGVIEELYAGYVERAKGPDATEKDIAKLSWIDDNWTSMIRKWADDLEESVDSSNADEDE
jgi:hypothetical protein